MTFDAAKPVPGAVGMGRRILVVDDDPVLRNLLAIQLEQAGFVPTTAENGDVALQEARRRHPAAIVSDILMPVLDGFQLCRAIRADPALAGVPVVLLSGVFVGEADRDLARSAGANAFLSRADGLHAVLSALAEALGPGPHPLPPPETPYRTEDYAQRAATHLDRLAGRDATLSRRVAVLEAQVAILSSIAGVMSSSGNLETALQGILQRCLTAAGFSRGVIWLGEEAPNLEPAAHHGFSEQEAAGLGNLFGCDDLVVSVWESDEPLLVPSPQISQERSGPLLRSAGVRSILLSQIRHEARPLGVLGMMSPKDIDGEDWLFFARAVGTQTAQVIQLVRSRTAEGSERLAGGVALELNNLLTVILGQADLLIRDVPEGDPVRRRGEEIRDAATRAAALAQQILALGRKQE